MNDPSSEKTYGVAEYRRQYTDGTQTDEAGLQECQNASI